MLKTVGPGTEPVCVPFLSFPFPINFYIKFPSVGFICEQLFLKTKSSGSRITTEIPNMIGMCHTTTFQHVGKGAGERCKFKATLVYIEKSRPSWAVGVTLPQRALLCTRSLGLCIPAVFVWNTVATPLHDYGLAALLLFCPVFPAPLNFQNIVTAPK